MDSNLETLDSGSSIGKRKYRAGMRNCEEAEEITRVWVRRFSASKPCRTAQ
ncbi:hypothetical protein BofuT4_P055000.1 [Botrytis cinerea T4]|uniref:Uncharacterized protein n=1 Tax=Botryotinia fuckeliana (strain T4) TaxID=999810 RepID=G2XVS9_BOTF4|nr:hypothetical protein BofuT4_P055000.1 [Botrytis cinerea T4]